MGREIHGDLTIFATQRVRSGQKYRNKMNRLMSPQDYRRSPSPARVPRRGTIKATASSRHGATQAAWDTVSRRTRRPPTPPRSNRTRRDHSNCAVDSAPVVVPPRSKRASKGRGSTEVEPPPVVVPPRQTEESKPSTTRCFDGKKGEKESLKNQGEGEES